MFEQVIPTFLQYGISHTDFWDLTLTEINMYLEAFNAQVKFKMESDYLLARNIASFVGCSLNGKDIPPIEKVYPPLYQPEYTVEQVKKDKAYMEGMLFKDQFTQYAKRYNKLRQKKEAINKK